MKKLEYNDSPSMFVPRLDLMENEELRDPRGTTYNELTLDDLRIDGNTFKDARCTLDKIIVAQKLAESNAKSDSFKRWSNAVKNK